ncbi:MAG TPA: GNAT family N-acetyltransferase [Symbiobacteriaceae bacterium]|nr:GNAT family N-acetyltransferase [Symbiobacteriaceae bacterium]
MQIRPLQRADLAAAIDIVSANGWASVPEQFAFQIDHPDCHQFVGEEAGQIVATAVATQRGTVGWIGQITVRPEFRGRGLGTAITRHTMNVLTALGCRTLLLFATEMGRPIYEKLGFAVESEFVVWTGPSLPALPVHSLLRPLGPADLDWICALDRRALGEDRSAQLRAFGRTGWVFGPDQGFLIPTPWGAQVISAATAEAGRTLLEVARATKHAEPDGVRIVLPSANRPGANYVVSQGFKQTARLPRMLIGQPLYWEPDLVFGRMSGALG